MSTFTLKSVDLSGDPEVEGPLEFTTDYPENPVEAETPEEALRSTLPEDGPGIGDAFAVTIGGWESIPVELTNDETGEVTRIDVTPNLEEARYDLTEVPA